jgi:ADP-ribose pyrophosphatase
LPGIVRRTETRLSDWVRLVEKDVRLREGGPIETYHAFTQPDYVSMLAVTRDGLIPLVRQFRPAVGEYTWELPGGLVDSGDGPEAACLRELREEVGLEADEIVPLGAFFPDTGRLENLIHTFFVRAGGPVPAFTPEAGLALDFVTPGELCDRIRRGSFRPQLHLGLLAAAAAAGLFTFSAESSTHDKF